MEVAEEELTVEIEREEMEVVSEGREGFTYKRIEMIEAVEGRLHIQF